MSLLNNRIKKLEAARNINAPEQLLPESDCIILNIPYGSILLAEFKAACLAAMSGDGYSIYDDVDYSQEFADKPDLPAIEVIPESEELPTQTKKIPLTSWFSGSGEPRDMIEEYDYE